MDFSHFDLRLFFSLSLLMNDRGGSKTIVGSEICLPQMYWPGEDIYLPSSFPSFR